MTASRRSIVAVLLCLGVSLSAQGLLPITTPKQALGFNVGDDYMVASYTQTIDYWRKLDAESDRMTMVDIGPTAEGRRQWMAVVSAPANLERLDYYKDVARRLALAEDLSEEDARALARAGKAVVWIDGGLHSNETVGAQQLIEMVYQMVSRTDAETLRLLEDTIQLYVPANPDGMELVANWYMREPEPARRSLAGLPRLYHKYIGHDDNRDFFLSSQPETTNMNRQMFLEWFPQIVYNHHQSGPAGAVVFIPPFRDPFNYNLDPLIPLGIETVGAAMHSRLVAEGKGGSAMRSGANYSTWWNGGLRTISYFHNMIGILTEIIGGPAPMDIALVPDRQLPQNDSPLPVPPGKWHYRQSIDYEISQNRAVLDYASRYRETLLFNAWRMGRNSIERGSRDSWTITPKRIAALKAAAAAGPQPNRVPPELYETLLHDPRLRDPRGYIIPSDQPDFLTAVKFVNALLKTGITVLRSAGPFQAGGRTYPAGTFIVKTAQAFRPHVLDMFEPQDHPNDFQYPGGPPVPPYDIAGWTLAMQMGIRYDRVLEDFDGPFSKVTRLLSPPAGEVSGPANPAGYLISRSTNDSFIMVNRLLKSGSEVYWLKGGTFWAPATPNSREVVMSAAADLGVSVLGVAQPPAGEAWRLRPQRIGLYDQYGGLVASGWTRWLLEQYEFPFEVVYPQTLDSGGLRAKFDVLLFPDEAFRSSGPGGNQPAPESIPAEYRAWLGRITQEHTLPQLRRFVEAGGSLLAIGSSTALGALLGVPVSNHLVETAPDGTTRPLPRDKFYVPGSLMRARIDTSHPLAHGMNDEALLFFDSSPVFRAGPGVRRVASFVGTETLASGWAWGQQYLDGAVAVAEAPVGAGRVVLYGPEVAFRGQSHGTFKLLFNGLFFGASESVVLPAPGP
jgi:hypothetical protein